MRRVAYTDLLTGLRNRLHFFRTVPPAFVKAVESNDSVMVAMVDIDHFKRVNDNYGHAGGDAALVHVAEMLREVLPGSMSVARFGGEEFCVVSIGMERDDAIRALEKLRRDIEASSVTFEGKTIRFTLSIGATFNVAPLGWMT